MKQKKLPTKRVALTLPGELDQVLTRLSKLTKQPKTAIITEILLEAYPHFVQVAEVLTQIKEGQREIAVNALGSLLGSVSNDLNSAHVTLGEMKGIVNAERSK